MGGFHAGPLTTTGSKAQLGNPLIVQVYQGADDPGMTQDMRTAFTVCSPIDSPQYPAGFTPWSLQSLLVCRVSHKL